MRFYLGTHQTEWAERTDVPLFLSARRLRVRRVPRALGPVALDSGGFSEVSQFGGYRTPAMTYSTEVRAWRSQVGNIEWAAIQDWMCEPDVIRGNAKLGWPGTRLSVREHQRLTIHSYGLLRQLAPDLPWAPVLQGWRVDDYLACARMYADAGHDLHAAAVVGVGSVCRRQATQEAVDIFGALHGAGLRNLHGFGLKTLGLTECAPYLASADSMAWSKRARDAWRHEGKRLCGGEHRSGGCANCYRWAMMWREQVLGVVVGAERHPVQGRLFA
jgi:hypothetical protein